MRDAMVLTASWEDEAWPIAEYRVTPHAAFEMARRGIDENVLQRVLGAPGPAWRNR